MSCFGGCCCCSTLSSSQNPFHKTLLLRRGDRPGSSYTSRSWPRMNMGEEEKQSRGSFLHTYIRYYDDDDDAQPQPILRVYMGSTRAHTFHTYQNDCNLCYSSSAARDASIKRLFFARLSLCLLPQYNYPDQACCMHACVHGTGVFLPHSRDQYGSAAAAASGAAAVAATSRQSGRLSGRPEMDESPLDIARIMVITMTIKKASEIG